MKNYFITLLIALQAIFFMNSCVDLEEVPEGSLTPVSFYKTTSDFEAAAIGNYKNLWGGWGGYDYFGWWALTAGAEDVWSPYGGMNEYDNFNFMRGTWNDDFWARFYLCLNNANTIITKLPNLEGVASVEKIKEFEGQAKFLRAYSYFNLVRTFGEVPIITSENQKDAENVGQSSVEEIYKLIVQDLKDAEVDLPFDMGTKGKANNMSAKLLLAKVYLTMAGWPIKDASMYELARDKADEVTGYELEPDFRDLWLVENRNTNSEFLWVFFGLSSIDGSHYHHAIRPGVEAGWSDITSEARFYYAFPEGYRKDVSFYTTFIDGSSWEDSDTGQPYIAKYRDGGPTACGMDDGVCANLQGDGFFPALRYADALLIYAEAANMAEGGPSAKALEAINKVRRRAMKLPVNEPNASVDLTSALSQSEFDSAVIAERNWEFAFEINRWYDLVRKEMVVEVNKDLHPNVKEYNRLIPKPINEVNDIEGLEQNEGYK